MKRIAAALAAVLLTAVSLAAQAPGSGPAVVKTIGFVKSDAGLEVNVAIDGVFAYEVSVLTAPDRLVIDISPAGRIEAQPSYEVNACGVTTVRTGQFKPRVSRVILDFSGPIPAYDVQKTGTGLVIKITGAAPAVEKVTAPAAAVQPAVEAKPAEEPKPAPLAPVAPVAAPAVPAARPESEKTEGPAGFYNTMFGVMGGSYKNPSDRFSEVYGTGTTLQFGADLSRTLLYAGGFQLDVSGEARLISKTGASTLSGTSTKISIYPLTLAGRVLFQTKYVIPFAGYGLDWFSYKETSSLANTSGSASGHSAQGGLYIVIPGMEKLRLKVYYKYTWVTATENDIEVGLGGPEYGVGVSLGFNVLNSAVAIF